MLSIGLLNFLSKCQSFFFSLFFLLFHHQLIILAIIHYPTEVPWAWDEDEEMSSLSAQSAGLGLKGLPVLREVSPSLWVTVEEKEWKWTCLFKSRSAFILWASQDPLASTITCFKESRGLGELPITLPSLGQLTTNIFGLCQGFLIYLIYQEWIHTPLLCSILVPLIPVSLPLPQLHH